MKKIKLMRLGVFLAIFAFQANVLAAAEYQEALDQNGIDQAFGKKGQIIDKTYKVAFPRSDLHVTVRGIVIKSGFALTSWAGFTKAGDSAVTYGDLAVLESEMNPVISKLTEKGIEVEAIHNHLIYENPRIFYIHFMGRGNEAGLAKGLKEALVLTGTPLTSFAAGNVEKSETAKSIEDILGFHGALKNGVLSIGVPRKDIHIKMEGADIPGSMGMSIPLNFQLDGTKAAINGDFMLLAEEVKPVMTALRANGIEIASLHNHMLDEAPRVFFMHFWAYGDAAALAKGLRAALDQTGAGK